MSQDKPLARPAREPQALSGEYHKARKQLMLWAGILFIWELVGIDLEKAKEAGGNAGAIITSIKSPQAIPWVLLVLVAYFLFKVWIEWNQCHGARRETLASRLDYRSAWVVAFLAVLLYVYQTISRIQVADVVQGSNRFTSVAVGLGAATFPVVVLLRVLGLGRGNDNPLKGIRMSVLIGVFMAPALLVILNWRRTLNIKWAALGLFLGVLPTIVYSIWKRKVTG